MADKLHTDWADALANDTEAIAVARAEGLYGPLYTLDGEETSLAELKLANPEGLDRSWGEIAAMKSGEIMTLGGGAWATFTLIRL